MLRVPHDPDVYEEGLGEGRDEGAPSGEKTWGVERSIERGTGGRRRIGDQRHFHLKWQTNQHDELHTSDTQHYGA